MPKTTVISFDLSVDGIEDAIRQIEAYQTWLNEKLQILRKKVAERIKWSASNGFTYALHADVLFGEPEPNDVTVDMRDDGNVSVVFARGKEAVFIEFGAGVWHNGAVGSNPHPWFDGNQQFKIGMYDKGYGSQPAWGYYRDGIRDREHLVVTRGTPANMPMFHGVKDALAVLTDLVEEVFGS